MIDTIICGDALTVLKEMESESVDCCICSPPYWSLRNYCVEGQIGLEKTPDTYINNLLAVFDEVKRVLKATGNVWVVIGTTFRDKCDLMIPERFALSMVDHGWIKRRTVIWQKPHCTPSSVKDDFTLDFEYVYRFVKQRKYYFEQLFEPYAEATLAQKGQDYHGTDTKDYKSAMAKSPGDIKRSIIKSLDENVGRHNRCVWRVNPKPLKEAHVATFPMHLIEPMILAGCPSAICDSCGYVYMPMQTPTGNRIPCGHPEGGHKNYVKNIVVPQRGCATFGLIDGTKKEYKTELKKCDCNPRPPTHAGIILDPFSGSGTTCLVARKLGRHYIGIDLSEPYCKMSRKRIAEIL